MNDYARVKGGAALPSAEEKKPVVYPKLSPAQPLTDAELSRVNENRLLVHQHIPEAIPFIGDLAKLGMIHGWRNVRKVEVFQKEKP